MRDKILNYMMSLIIKDNKYDKTKLEEIKYGLYAIYTLITKTFVIIVLSLILNIFKEFLLFFVFYVILRSVGYGTHAKSNGFCWIFSILLLLGLPYLFTKINLSLVTKIIIWSICFLNYFIFCPADTEKRPMISVKRKLKFKISILAISIIYLILVIKYTYLSNYILGAMILEAILSNPLGYLLMGQKVRFRLNDINLNKIRMEV